MIRYIPCRSSSCRIQMFVGTVKKFIFIRYRLRCLRHVFIGYRCVRCRGYDMFRRLYTVPGKFMGTSVDDCLYRIFSGKRFDFGDMEELVILLPRIRQELFADRIERFPFIVKKYF